MSPASGIPTMFDVAARAGVSHQTVSRVVNGSTSIRPETRERVVGAIVALGYRRNALARSLARRRSDLIGVLSPAVTEYGPVATTRAIEAEIHARGLHPLVSTTALEKHDLARGLEFLLENAVEGIVVVASHAETRTFVTSQQLSVPIVGLYAERGPAIDHEFGAFAAVRHLIHLGHREIQHVAGPDTHIESEQRHRGYLQAIRSSGLPELPVISGNWTAESGYAAARSLRTRTSAVFCANDQMALGVIRRLAESGLCTPDDVSVIGFDDIPEARYFDPPLTTVRQDFADLARRAIDLLQQRISGGGGEGGPPMTPQLIVRESSRPYQD